MIKALKNKYALSNQGAKDLLKGIIYSVLANISLMFPVILLAIVLNQLLAPILGTTAPEISAVVYTVIGIVILAVVFIFHYCQYTATYLGTYDESARGVGIHARRLVFCGLDRISLDITGGDAVIAEG